MRSVCLDCAQIDVPTAVTIGQLARLQLAMRRCGCELEISNAQPCLLELIGLFGLAEVLRVESQRHAEEREDLSGVEEKRELGDSAIR
jgi:anti-anti-sigma regulatory factor